MATIRNNTVWDFPLSNGMVIPAKTTLTCADTDLTQPEIWRAVWPMTICGDLSIVLIDEPAPPVPDSYVGPETVEAPPPPEPAPEPAPIIPQPDAATITEGN